MAELVEFYLSQRSEFTIGIFVEIRLEHRGIVAVFHAVPEGELDIDFDGVEFHFGLRNIARWACVLDRRLPLRIKLQSEEANWTADILHLLLAHIFEAVLDFVSHLIAHPSGDANPAAVARA